MTVQDVINQLKKEDPNTQVHFRAVVECGTGCVEVSEGADLYVSSKGDYEFYDEPNDEEVLLKDVVVIELQGIRTECS